MAITADKVNLALRSVACILEGVPSTLLIPLPLTMALTRRYCREEQLKRLHLMVPWARFCCKHLLAVKLDVQGQENLPRPSKGYMYVSNHQSYIDILVLMGALDTVAFLSKSLVRRIPVIGRCAYAGGTVYLSRREAGSRQRALRETIRMCRESTAVVIFPEGTRSAEGRLRRQIHPRAIRAAYAHGLQIIPVGLDGTHRVVPKTMDTLRPGQRVAVTIGAPLDPACFSAEQSWVDAVWARVEALWLESRGRISGAPEVSTATDCDALEVSTTPDRDVASR